MMDAYSQVHLVRTFETDAARRNRYLAHGQAVRPTRRSLRNGIAAIVIRFGTWIQTESAAQELSCAPQR